MILKRSEFLDFILKLFAAFFLCSLCIYLARESPLQVIKIFLESAISSKEGFSLTLFYFTPLLFTATSVYVAEEAGLFNIGSEGQIYVGALSGIATATWIASHLPSEFGLLISMAACFLGGFCWAAIAGILKYRFRIHEVISFILLNFIAYSFSNWSILNVFKNVETQGVETNLIAPHLQISNLWLNTPKSILLSLLILLVSFLFFKKTWGGFRARVLGLNPIAAVSNGISPLKVGLSSLCISGGISGLVGFHEVFCHSYKLIDSFSPGFGFTGLVIASISNKKIYRIFAFSFFFAMLFKSGLDLEIETERMTKDITLLVQAVVLIVFSVRFTSGAKT